MYTVDCNRNWPSSIMDYWAAYKAGLALRCLASNGNRYYGRGINPPPPVPPVDYVVLSQQSSDPPPATDAASSSNHSPLPLRERGRG